MTNPTDKTDKAAPPAPKRDRFIWYLVVAMLCLVVGIVVAWRRTHHPARVWARKVETAHLEKIERPLTRCFGSAASADIRRLADRIHRGPLPAPFRACRGGPIAELMIAPTDFLGSMTDAPSEVQRLRDRERRTLDRLTASLRRLEQAVTRGGPTPDDAQREAIASALEDVAPEVEQERSTIRDLLAAAREAAPIL